MKRVMLILTLVALLLSAVGFCGSETDSIAKQARKSMDSASKEAKEFAKLKGSDVIEMIDNFDKTGSMGIEDDLLPEEDKGNSFDGFEEQQSLNPDRYDPDLKSTADSAKYQEKLEGTEPEFQSAQRITLSPTAPLNIDRLTTEHQKEEVRIDTCIEGESKMYREVLSRKVSVVPGKTVYRHVCKGHTKKYKKSSAEKAQEKQQKKYQELGKDPSVKYKSSTLNGKNLTIYYEHHDDSSNCDAFSKELVSKTDPQITESWEPEHPKHFNALNANPRCKVIGYAPIGEPATKTISGVPILRDIWKREAIFKCAGDNGIKCRSLQALGGVLVSKRCLRTDVNGECDLWEKSYDIGRKGPHAEHKALFAEEEIWGLNQNQPIAHEKNTDLGQVIGTLSAFGDVKSELVESDQDVSDKLQVFKGKSSKCGRTIVDGVIFDCCQKMKGLALDVKLADCSAEEQCLAKDRQEEKCHFIGSRSTKLGTVTEQVYCCFPTKLARIIHEQGREQLGIAWGEVDKPKCRGFSLGELKRIDFGRLDLSDVLPDLNIDKVKLTKKLQQAAEQLAESQVTLDVSNSEKELEALWQQRIEHASQTSEVQAP